MKTLSCGLKRIGLITVTAGLFAGVSQAGTIFDYPDFSSTSGLTLVGTASQATTGDGTVLRVTAGTSSQHGAAYWSVPVELGSGNTFSTSFAFRFTNPGGWDPADGITFVLAKDPTNLASSNGSSLGYTGVNNSVAVEFDTYANPGETSSNHVAVDTNGYLNNYFAVDPYGVGSCGFTSGGNPNQNSYLTSGCMSNGDLWSATIGYDGANLSMSLWDKSGPYAEASPYTIYTSQPLDVASYLGTSTPYVGFTGSTGAGWQNQDIVDWTFANTAQLPSTTSEPATLALIFGGMAGLALLEHRRGSGC